ncbi:MAG: hypothetical protein JO243_16875 [Solirubrobacterales bacterium]|nr:hypothetical protein [Solirubrobacterales bacterium]
MVTRSTAVRRSELESTSAARAREALDRGDLEAARAEIDGILAEEKPIHDLYGDMCASFLSFIASKLGEEAVDEAWRYVADDVWKPVLMQFKDSGGPEAMAHAFAVFLISHRYDFSVLEDDEKWTFEVGYCTSGERMVVEGKVAHNGGHAAGHHHFGSTSRAYPWSLEKEHFPYYDVHSALWFKLLPEEWGWGVMDVEYDHKSHGEVAVTKYLIYKQPRSARA